MSWELTIWNALGGGTPAVYADTDSTVSILGTITPTARVEPPDAPVDLKFESTPLLMPEMSPRSIVLWKDITNPTPTTIFWGPVVKLPAPESEGAGPLARNRQNLQEYQAEGGNLLLLESIIDTPMVLEEQDIHDIAFTLCDTYAHPALTITAGNFTGTVGNDLEIFFAPEMVLADALDELAEQYPNYRWYVNSLGEVIFEEFTP